MKLAELLKDSAYKLTQFKPAQIAALEARITLKTTDKATTPYVTCLVRGKPIASVWTPCEILLIFQ